MGGRRGAPERVVGYRAVQPVCTTASNRQQLGATSNRRKSLATARNLRQTRALSLPGGKAIEAAYKHPLKPPMPGVSRFRRATIRVLRVSHSRGLRCGCLGTTRSDHPRQHPNGPRADGYTGPASASVGPSRHSHHTRTGGGGGAGIHWKGGPPSSLSRAPSLSPATVSLTASASFHGICNRQ